MSSIFGFIIHPMELGLIWVAVNVGSAGIGIILFTVFVRLVLSPLNIVQLRSARAMQKLQPHIADLKKKHGKDREALSKATMELYKAHNVNPAMGCLPMLLQFPILIGLFYALRALGSAYSGYPKHFVAKNQVCGGFHIHTQAQWLAHCYSINGATGNAAKYFDLFHAHFLWLANGLGGHDPLFILPILAGVAQWVQSRMTLTQSVDPQQKMMNQMMNFMPLMIVFFAANYPSGLSLYWVTSTLIGILIQFRITGWGLLPDTLRGLSGTLSGRPAPARSLQPAKPKAPTAEAKPTPEVELNGKEDGDVRSQPTAPVARQRKRGKARGGRSGRRG